MPRRLLIYQILLAAGIAALGWLLFSITQENLARLGVDSNFNFLFRRAGFEIGQTLIPFSAGDSILRAFVVAVLNTIVLAGAAIVCASILGLALGLARLSGNWLLARMALAYVEIFRNVPALLQIFFWYFVVLRTLPRSAHSTVLWDAVVLNNRGLFLPGPAGHLGAVVMVVAVLAAIGISWAVGRWAARRRHETGGKFPVAIATLLLLPGLPLLAAWGAGVQWEFPQAGRFGYAGGIVLLPEFLALVCGLSMYNATYISEIVRSSFSALPRGQLEAAESLGFSRHVAVRLILLPQALRIMIPPLTTVYLNLFKSTSLAAAIAYPEVVSVFVGTVNNLVGQPVSIMALTLVTYAFVSLSIALYLNWYQRRLAARGT
jgi:general L-amino acid transport system permease protein